jgi:mono/diheme cytochrome c family protein
VKVTGLSTTQLVVTLAVATALLPSADGSPPVPNQRWAAVRVDLPVSATQFPPGPGADIATSQCLICHSADMVLLQPRLTREQWIAEINKMRSAFGAPIPADQIEAVANYLDSIGAR